jgi:hypothetical protein
MSSTSSAVSTPAVVVVAMTPYAAAKVANAVLLARGIDKVLPPQMFYNYTSARIRTGKAPFIACDANGKITTAGLTTWTEKYIAKLLAKA